MPRALCGTAVGHMATVMAVGLLPMRLTMIMTQRNLSDLEYVEMLKVDFAKT